MNQQIVIDNNLISYQAFGSKGATNVIVFLHGWRSSKEVWQGIVGKLGSEFRSIYVLDLPGFGASSLPKRDFLLSDYADIVAEFIKKNNLNRVVVVGHSFGGRIGIKLASTYPGLIEKLVLVDSAGFSMDKMKKNLFAKAAKAVKPIFKLPFTQGLRKVIYKSIGAEDYLATPELQKTFVNVVSEDLTEEMKKIVCPTLIIWGEDDKETPLEFGRRMELKIKNSKLKILNDAGHFSFIDNPAEFTNQLTGFIKA